MFIVVFYSSLFSFLEFISFHRHRHESSHLFSYLCDKHLRELPRPGQVICLRKAPAGQPYKNMHMPTYILYIYYVRPHIKGEFMAGTSWKRVCCAPMPPCAISVHISVVGQSVKISKNTYGNKNLELAYITTLYIV